MKARNKKLIPPARRRGRPPCLPSGRAATGGRPYNKVDAAQIAELETLKLAAAMLTIDVLAEHEARIAALEKKK